MTFISWRFIGKYKNNSQVYEGFESEMTTHKKPRDQECLELLTDVINARTIAIHGFETVSCTILNIC